MKNKRYTIYTFFCFPFCRTSKSYRCENKRADQKNRGAQSKKCSTAKAWVERDYDPLKESKSLNYAVCMFSRWVLYMLTNDCQSLTILPVLQIITLQTEIDKLANVAANDTDYIKLRGEWQTHMSTTTITVGKLIMPSHEVMLFDVSRLQGSKT